MFTGIGAYYLKRGDKVYPLCVSGFSLTPDRTVGRNSYKNYGDRITYNKRNNFITEGWTLTLDHSVINIEVALGLDLLPTLASPEIKTLTTYENQVVEEPYWNLTKGLPNGELEVGDKFYKLSRTGVGSQIINGGGHNFDSYQFRGTIYTNGKPTHFLTIGEMYRKETTTLTPGRPVSTVFEVIEPKIHRADGDVDQLEGFVVFASVPEEYVADSKIILAGRIIITNNPNNIPVFQIPITTTFDFAQPGTEVRSLTTSPDGTFNIEYNVASNLTFPRTGVLKVVLDENGSTAFEQGVRVKNPKTSTFDFEIIGGKAQFNDITLSGVGVPGSDVVIRTNGLDGLFDNVVVPVRLNGTWSTSDTIPESLELGDNYSITASLQGFNDVVRTSSITQSFTFQPLLVYENGVYRTGLRSILVNDRTVRPNQTISITAESSELRFVDTTLESSNDGSFELPFTIPVSEQGKEITWTFTELLTNDSVLRADNAPAFDPNMVIELNDNQGQLEAGQSAIKGTYSISPGHDLTIELRDSTNEVVGSESYENNPTGSQPFSVDIDEDVAPGNFSITFSSPIHNTVNINPVPVDIVEALTINKPNGLVYPGRQITISGKGPANSPLTVNVFGSDVDTNVSDNQTWSIDVITPEVGSYPVIVESDGRQETTTINVETVSLTLEGCNEGGTYFTNDDNGFASFSGELLPNKVLRVSFTGLPLEPVLVVPNENGRWNLDFSVPWVERGQWSATFEADGEATLTCSGSHEPKIVFIPETVEFEQGDFNNTIRVRGKANTAYSFNITGELEDSGNISTNDQGFATLFLKDIPLFTQAVSSGQINVGGGITTYTINPKVPITVGVSNPSVSPNVLFTEEAFNVVGSIPKNGVYSLAAIGDVEAFTLDTVRDNNTYSATLETSDVPGLLEITVGTIYQDSVVENYVVSPPLYYSIPDSLISNNSYPITITSQENELVELLITGDVDGVIVYETVKIDNTGTFDYTFDTTGVSEGQTLTFTIRNQYFTHTPQERLIGGFGTGVPEPLNTGVNSSNSKVSYPDYSITNLVIGLDNSPVSEAGKIDDLDSNLEVSWTSPKITNNFINYLVEVYDNGWKEFERTTDNNSTPDGDNVRIKAIHSSMVSGDFVYTKVDKDNLLAKSHLSTGTNQSHEFDVIIERPLITAFYSFTTELVHQETLGTGVNSSSTINETVIPQETRTIYTILSQLDNQDSLTTGVNSTHLIENIDKPQERTPFYTI